MLNFPVMYDELNSKSSWSTSITTGPQGAAYTLSMTGYVPFTPVVIAGVNRGTTDVHGSFNWTSTLPSQTTYPVAASWSVVCGAQQFTFVITVTAPQFYLSSWGVTPLSGTEGQTFTIMAQSGITYGTANQPVYYTTISNGVESAQHYLGTTDANGVISGVVGTFPPEVSYSFTFSLKLYIGSYSEIIQTNMVVTGPAYNPTWTAFPQSGPPGTQFTLTMSSYTPNTAVVINNNNVGSTNAVGGFSYVGTLTSQSSYPAPEAWNVVCGPDSFNVVETVTSPPSSWSINPTSGPPGTQVTLNMSYYAPNAAVTYTTYTPSTGITTGQASIGTTGSTGAFALANYLTTEPSYPFTFVNTIYVGGVQQFSYTLTVNAPSIPPAYSITPGSLIANGTLNVSVQNAAANASVAYAANIAGGGLGGQVTLGNTDSSGNYTGTINVGTRTNYTSLDVYVLYVGGVNVYNTMVSVQAPAPFSYSVSPSTTGVEGTNYTVTFNYVGGGSQGTTITKIDTVAGKSSGVQTLGTTGAAGSFTYTNGFPSTAYTNGTYGVNVQYPYTWTEVYYANGAQLASVTFTALAPTGTVTISPPSGVVGTSYTLTFSGWATNATILIDNVAWGSTDSNGNGTITTTAFQSPPGNSTHAISIAGATGQYTETSLAPPIVVTFTSASRVQGQVYPHTTMSVTASGLIPSHQYNVLQDGITRAILQTDGNGNITTSTSGNYFFVVITAAQMSLSSYTSTYTLIDASTSAVVGNATTVNVKVPTTYGVPNSITNATLAAVVDSGAPSGLGVAASVPGSVNYIGTPIYNLWPGDVFHQIVNFSGTVNINGAATAYSITGQQLLSTLQASGNGDVGFISGGDNFVLAPLNAGATFTTLNAGSGSLTLIDASGATLGMPIYYNGNVTSDNFNFS